MELKIYCKDCRYLKTWIVGYGGCRSRETACQNSICFTTRFDPIHGPMKERTSNCRELNKNCDCRFYQEKQIVLKKQKRWIFSYVVSEQQPIAFRQERDAQHLMSAPTRRIR